MLSITAFGSRLASRTAGKVVSSSASKSARVDLRPKNRWNSFSTASQTNGKDWVGTVLEDKSSGESPALAQALRANLEPSASGVKGGADAKKRAEEVQRATTGHTSSNKKGASKTDGTSSPWAV